MTENVIPKELCAKEVLLAKTTVIQRNAQVCHHIIKRAILNIISAWSDWSPFTSCSKSCNPGSDYGGPGEHIRNRVCLHNEENQCAEGKPIETAECNTAACKGMIYGILSLSML